MGWASPIAGSIVVRVAVHVAVRMAMQCELAVGTSLCRPPSKWPGTECGGRRLDHRATLRGLLTVLAALVYRIRGGGPGVGRGFIERQAHALGAFAPFSPCVRLQIGLGIRLVDDF